MTSRQELVTLEQATTELGRNGLPARRHAQVDIRRDEKVIHAANRMWKSLGNVEVQECTTLGNELL